MKRIITIIFASVSLLSSKFSTASQLNLKMFDNSMFSIMLDGNYAGQPTTCLSIDLAAGEHNLKVAKCITGPWGMMQFEQVFAGCINIPMHSKVFATISCHGCYDVNKVEPICEQPQWGGWNNNGNGGWGNGNGWGHGHGNGNGNGGWNQGGNNNGGCGAYMTPQQFDQLKCVVNNQDFDNGKLAIVKQALMMNYFCSAQVSELMSMMTFDSYKLTMAESCYPKTIDKQNFYLVNSNFVFSSSANELNQYISHM